MHTEIKSVLLATIAGFGLAACSQAPEGESTANTQTTPQMDAQAMLAELPLGGSVILPDYRTITLDNGARLILVEKHDVPLIAFNALLHGGALGDPAGMDGLANITAQLLEKGAGDRDARQFAEAVAAVGGAFGTGADTDSVTVAGEFMAKDVDLLVELLSDALMRPDLSADEFSKLRDRSIQQIQDAKSNNPQGVLSSYAARFVFGDHAYGRESDGDEASLADLGIADVRAYYRDHIGADRMQLTVVGDFDAEQMEASLRAAFGDWRAASAAVPEVDAPVAQNVGRVLLVDKPDAVQTYFWIGDLGLDVRYPRDATLDLVNTAFGGRFTSMLNTALRIETGLTYGARSSFWRPAQAGTFSIRSFTETSTTIEAVDLALEVLDRLHADGLDAATLRSVQAYNLGQNPPDFETADDLAGQIAYVEFYGLGREHVDGWADAVIATDLEAVREVIADAYPTRDRLTFVLIGNADAFRDELTKYGGVTEINITELGFGD